MHQLEKSPKQKAVLARYRAPSLIKPPCGSPGVKRSHIKPSDPMPIGVPALIKVRDAGRTATILINLDTRVVVFTVEPKLNLHAGPTSFTQMNAYEFDRYTGVLIFDHILRYVIEESSFYYELFWVCLGFHLI